MNKFFNEFYLYFNMSSNQIFFIKLNFNFTLIWILTQCFYQIEILLYFNMNFYKCFYQIEILLYFNMKKIQKGFEINDFFLNPRDQVNLY